jgi:hypothetical protein
MDADDPSSLASALRRLAEDRVLRATLRAGGLATAPLHTEQMFNEAVEQALLDAAGVVRGQVPLAAAS